MKEKIKITKAGLGVDIDETLAWTVGHWVKEMQKLFGNPENLTVKELVDKYNYTQNVPYWQTPEAEAWMEEKRKSDDFQKEIPLIENANHFLNKINDVIPIAAYITIRPESVSKGTQHWLEKHNFPRAPIIFRPNKIPTKEGNKWKAKLLKELYPNILGFIDDSPRVIEALSEDYKGKIFHYNKIPAKTNLKVTNCDNWENVYKEVKNFEKDMKKQTIEEYNRKNNNKLPIITGEKVILAPVPDSKEFYKLYHTWLSNKELKFKLGEEKMEYTHEEIKKMHDEWRNDFKNMTFCILNKETKEPIGDINLFDSEEFYNMPEISIMLGQHSGKGFGTEASQLLINFAFKELKLKEIYLSVYKDNLPAIGLYKKLGFQTYGETKDEDNREELLMKLIKE